MCSKRPLGLPVIERRQEKIYSIHATNPSRGKCLVGINQIPFLRLKHVLWNAWVRLVNRLSQYFQSCFKHNQWISQDRTILFIHFVLNGWSWKKLDLYLWGLCGGESAPVNPAPFRPVFEEPEPNKTLFCSVLASLFINQGVSGAIPFYIWGINTQREVLFFKGIYFIDVWNAKFDEFWRLKISKINLRRDRRQFHLWYRDGEWSFSGEECCKTCKSLSWMIIIL